MIRLFCLFCLLCMATSACSSPNLPDTSMPPATTAPAIVSPLETQVAEIRQQERPDFEQFFQHAGVEGAFVLYDRNQETYLVYNPERVDTPYIPASTFKIFNSLVALETGVVQDESEIIPWDGVKREVPEWNQDLDMRSAIQYSAVWFYQELARRIGQERMQQYIDQVEYGNKDIDGGIDHFWLDGDLCITARQQVDFLRRLYHNDLPFSQRSMDIVQDILIIEKTPEYVLRAKTGWGARLTPQIGWWVGYLEQGGNVYFFATNLDIVKPGDEDARISVTQDILRSLGLLDAANNR